MTTFMHCNGLQKGVDWRKVMPPTHETSTFEDQAVQIYAVPASEVNNEHEPTFTIVSKFEDGTTAAITLSYANIKYLASRGEF